MGKRILCLAAALLFLAGCGKTPSAPPATSEDWAGPISVNVPILMYHHMDETGGTDTTISEAGFRRQMDVLKDNGCTPVSFDELIAFVNGDGALPENPVCITFDDGYMSTYETAYPILGDYGFPATVFVIGVSVGQEYYKDTEYPITPHFGLAEMEEMAASGRMAVQSHTFDMHQWGPYEDTDAPRTSMLPLEGESEEEYAAAIREDFRLEQDVLARGGVERIDVAAFPLGRHTDLTDRLLQELGVLVTLTVDSSHINTVTRGEPGSLYNLGRLNMTDQTTEDELLTYLAQ